MDSPLAEIDAAVLSLKAGRGTWFDKLPPDAADTLAAAREKFRSGGYGDIPKLAMARVLVEYAATQGWKTCDYKRMAEWLANQT